MKIITGTFNCFKFIEDFQKKNPIKIPFLWYMYTAIKIETPEWVGLGITFYEYQYLFFIFRNNTWNRSTLSLSDLSHAWYICYTEGYMTSNKERLTCNSKRVTTHIMFHSIVISSKQTCMYIAKACTHYETQSTLYIPGNFKLGKIY